MVVNDEEELVVEDKSYSVGSQISLYSSVSEKSFSGVITAITPAELVLRLDCGARVRVYLPQIRNRR